MASFSLWWCPFFASTSLILFFTFCLQCCLSGSVGPSRNCSLYTRDICPLVVFLNGSPFLLLTPLLFVCSRLCASYVVPSTRFRSIVAEHFLTLYTSHTELCLILFFGLTAALIFLLCFYSPLNASVTGKYANLCHSEALLCST